MNGCQSSITHLSTFINHCILASILSNRLCFQLKRQDVFDTDIVRVMSGLSLAKEDIP